MPKFIAFYDIGYGQMEEVVEAKDQEDADMRAYQLWSDAVQSNANYWAEPLTPENAAEYDFEDDLDD